MAKKVDTPAPEPGPEPEPEPAPPVVEKPVEQPVDEPVKEKPAPVDDEDDMAFVKREFAKKLLDGFDIDTIKRYAVECEGKSLKFKSTWLDVNGKKAVVKAAGLKTGDEGAVGRGPPTEIREFSVADWAKREKIYT